ncbi:MAG: 3-isopropylmalate dehydratase small subunit [Candidatus Omnitrophica bacterium]|nr:3-isopropylmalate dehydratase small subunit [Candidatus Omnitrophota bacterium]
MKLKGKAFKFGNNINTDEIIPARYLNTIDPKILGTHCMEDADTKFSIKVKRGDVIVGGKNFGCGSSREHAPVSIKACGVSCVIAESFARIFFRNSINIGLPILESKEASRAIKEGDLLEIDLADGKIINKTKRKEYLAQPFPDFMQKIIKAGGLMKYVKRRTR